MLPYQGSQQDRNANHNTQTQKKKKKKYDASFFKCFNNCFVQLCTSSFHLVQTFKLQSDVKIPIVQNEANDPYEESTSIKKKGKNKKNKDPSNRRMTMEGQIQNKNDIMKKIPPDAEGVTVLVGEMNCLERPVLSFVRLAEGTQLDGLTEIPIPVRFLFVLLGPGGGDVDYYEIGRCFSTLMSSEVKTYLIICTRY